MKLFRLVLFFLPVFAGANVRAETPSEIPNPRQNARSWVADNANVLAPQQKDELHKLLAALERKTGDEFTVVTVRNLGGQDIESFGDELARRWRVGKSGRDNGLLLLVSIQERKARFEVGYGLSEQLGDARTGEILRQEVRPAFRRGDYAAGLLNASRAVVQILAPEVAVAPSSGETVQARRSPDVFPSVPIAGSSRHPLPSLPDPPQFAGPLGAGSGAFLLFLLGSGAVAGGVAFALTRPRKCSKCGGKCDPLDQIEESRRLKEGEVWEEHLGARDYTIWKCQKCAHEELEVKDRFFTIYQPCRKCGFKTAASHAQTIASPTYFSGGVERITVRCELPSCGENWFFDRATPRLSPPSRRRYYGGGFGIGMGTGIATGGWGSGGANDGGGFSVGDSGPADFGGGDFGGDGASSD